MARTELPHGIILPAEYSDDWYDDMTSNLSKLDEVIGSDAEKLSEEDVGAAALSNDYTDLDNKPVLKPVATSGDYDDLDNKPVLKPVATSGDYDDLTDLPTYGITRLCSSAITDNSSIAFSAISSTDKIKAGDFLLDTVGKMYQISSVDTANETVSVTTPLTQLAVDSSVMHLSGDETIAGEKTFSSNLTTPGLRSISSTEIRGQGSNILSLYSTLVFLNGDPSITARLNFRVFGSDNSKSLYPHETGQYVLGLTSRRYANTWTNAINTLNPGDLCFPNLSSGLDISSYITVNGGNKESLYTPLSDGWISVALTRSGGANMAVMLRQGNFASSGHNIQQMDGTTTCNAMLPVVGGVQVSINSALADGIYFAYFYPNKGNV